MSLESARVKKEPDYDDDALLTLKCAKDAKSDGTLSLLIDRCLYDSTKDAKYDRPLSYLSLPTDAYYIKEEPDYDGVIGDAVLKKYMKEDRNCDGDSLLTSTKDLSECGISLPTSSYCTKDLNCDKGLPNTCFIKEEVDHEFGVGEAAARAELYVDHRVKEELVLGPELVQAKPDTVQGLLGLSQVKLKPGPESTCGRHPTLRDCYVKLERIPIDKLNYNTVAIKNICTLQGDQKYLNMHSNALAIESCSAICEHLVRTDISDCESRRGQRHSHVEYDQLRENRKNVSGMMTKRIYICNTCNKQFVVRKSFILHLRKHKRDNPFECNICGRKFSEKIHLMRHCNTCKKRFVTRSALVNYIRKRLGENMCEICHKSFASAHSLDRHKLIHTEEKPFTCDACQMQFRYKDDLVVHIQDHSKQFSHNLQLIAHKRSHTGEKHFECDICKRSFSASNNLKKHKLTHMKERPFPCDICDKQFVRRDNLIKHKQLHTGEKPFNCEICEKAFRSRENLVYHLRIHSQDSIIKPYSCDICGNSFRIRSHLTRHTRTHTGEKPFTCNICEKSFSHKTTLTSHMRTHTGEKPYSCDMCSRQFTTSGNLLQHKRKEH